MNDFTEEESLVEYRSLTPEVPVVVEDTPTN